MGSGHSITLLGGKRRCPALAILLAGPVFHLHVLAAPLIEPGRTNELGVRDFLRLVLERNESLHARVLEFEIAQQHLKGERGFYEPELVLSYDRVENKRENTAEQRRSSGVAVFEEDNNIYNAGLEALVPTGAKIRL